MPKVGIIISNYNGWQDTLVCLESLQRQTFTDFEIILIDDASPNDSVVQLQDKLRRTRCFCRSSRMSALRRPTTSESAARWPMAVILRCCSTMTRLRARIFSKSC